MIISVDIAKKSFVPYAIAVSESALEEPSAASFIPWLYVSNVGAQANFITRSELDGSQVEIFVDQVCSLAFYSIALYRIALHCDLVIAMMMMMIILFSFLRFPKYMESQPIVH